MSSKSLITGLCLVLFSNAALGASCAQPVYHLNPGQPAACEGYLFSPEKEKQLRLLQETSDFIQQEADLKDKEITLYKQKTVDLAAAEKEEAQKAEIWRKSAEDSTQKLVEADKDRSFRDWAFLAAGILLTVGAGYAVGQAHK
jgi:hypothetical protein